MADERIIDLGYPDLLGEPERPRRSDVGRVRLIGLAALTLTFVAALGGAARPPAAALTHVGLITWPRGALAEGWLPMLAAGLLMTEVEGEVFAYHPDGRLAWRSRPITDPNGDPAFYNLIVWEGSILLVHGSLRMVGQGARASAIVSVALDPATGRERWRMEGTLQRVGDLVMVTGDPWDGPRGRRIYRFLPDGLLWTVPPARMIVADTETDALMTLTDEGLFTEYQLSTGTPRRSAQLRLPHVGPGEESLSLQQFRDRLIVRVSRFSPAIPLTETLSYDRATL